ncbi:alpha/beta hydrolase [Kribbella sp. CA-293567]|uniref:alpha/beta hydrolase n=1 Tax=Kribbella sp. CA-293567 TaxID=3002436 RepID=UPI0022DD14B6|nr:alpha/beta hydrolase [Kribbella sp. CA-293567]WBQ04608.1 alpha/beta hydrolase [Kribbella sp. CA-293567]
MNRRVDTLLRTALDAVQGNALKPVTALPTAVRRRLAGAPIQIDGNVLDPELQLLMRIDGLLPNTTKQSVATARANLLTMSKLVAGHPRELLRVTELTVRGADGQLGARLYVPRSAPTSGGGLLVFFHGGGWVVGDLDSHDAYCRALADDAGIRVLAVDYRLAPEAEAPVAAEDAIAAFNWALEHAEDLGADPAYVGVGGDSAGGNLAAVVAQQCVLRGFAPPAHQILIYPALDLVGRRPSRDLFAEGFFLSDPDILWYRAHYTPDPAIRPSPLVSPLLAEDLTGLAPAIIVTAGFDPLRDEGNEYATRLTAAGVPVTHTCEPAMVHGFANILALPGETRAAQSRLTDSIRGALNPAG